MENASKAIIIAGGILIGVIILSVLVMVFRAIAPAYEENSTTLSIEQLERYNRQFNLYDKSLYGSELLSLKNLLEDYNNRVLQDSDINFRKENEITVIVRLYHYEADELLDEHGVKKKTNYRKGDMKGEYVLVETESNKATGQKGQLKNYLDTLSNDTESGSNAETLLKEFKNMPFVCISNQEVATKYIAKGYEGLTSANHNTYNSAGRIKSMYFVQVVDENYNFYF